ncbi:hypothetical protein AGLY_002744 [Aphis glycines]|uniref:Uncharacterized protein n=1 Tax=Aphis glycines TaxID=307491 RepID=A0A6G0U1L8_APHGL|nr:hypothetical protein AGLY_002744 [Aphis glycines]
MTNFRQVPDLRDNVWKKTKGEDIYVNILNTSNKLNIMLDNIYELRSNDLTSALYTRHILVKQVFIVGIPFDMHKNLFSEIISTLFEEFVSSDSNSSINNSCLVCTVFVRMILLLHLNAREMPPVLIFCLFKFLNRLNFALQIHNNITLLISASKVRLRICTRIKDRPILFLYFTRNCTLLTKKAIHNIILNFKLIKKKSTDYFY